MKNESFYLLSVCIRLECNVPVIVVCKFYTYDLGTVVILEQGFYLLIKEHSMKIYYLLVVFS